MDRRDSIKSMLVGGVAGGFLLTGCQPVTEETSTTTTDTTASGYGRTEKEKAHDAKLYSEVFFNEHEITTIAVLCDLILPATATAGSATDAGVPEFIEFIVKDIREHQIPMRGGMMWMDSRANKLFGRDFASCTTSQQTQLLDEIAYPDGTTPEVEQGVRFFSRMRNLILTGYYTTRIGIDDLGYQGNVANVWNGVPDEVLAKHGLEYDQEWLLKCVDQDKREVIAQWDEDGNLIS